MLKATRFDSPYVLISFSVTERRDRTVWEVYGWKNGSESDDVGEFTYEADALYAVFSFGLPVIMGRGDTVTALAQRLEPQRA